jgi:hypothetical protein
MTIEYLPWVKPGGKISLTDHNPWEEKAKLPRPEVYLSDLKVKLVALAERLRADYGEYFTSDGQLNMVGRDTTADTSLVAEKVHDWSTAEGKTSADWLASREKNPANITEIATTLLFDKILGDEFIVVRASTFDDYEHGADQLIIDKQTGAVICGLDDVIGHLGDDGGAKKAEKINRKMAKGGAIIKYGATLNA